MRQFQVNLKEYPRILVETGHFSQVFQGLFLLKEHELHTALLSSE